VHFEHRHFRTCVNGLRESPPRSTLASSGSPTSFGRTNRLITDPIFKERGREGRARALHRLPRAAQAGAAGGFFHVFARHHRCV